MATRADSPDLQGGFQGQIPPVEPLLSEVIATLALAAHAYLTDEEGRGPDHQSAEVAIDVATAAFERVKERLRPEERLAITQMLTETRLTFVRKRGT
jgi:cation transport regulator ChaB